MYGLSRSLHNNLFNFVDFAISSLEGRVSIQDVNNPNSSDNFAFKCHRKKAKNNQKAQVCAHTLIIDSILIHSFFL